jgi:hypothetical protein
MWQDNIKMDHKGTGSVDVDWIHMVQNRHQRDQWEALPNAVMNILAPEVVGNFWTSWATVSFPGFVKIYVIMVIL